MTRGSIRVNSSNLLHPLALSKYFSLKKGECLFHKGALVVIYKKNVNTLDFHSCMRDKTVRVRAQLSVEIHLHNSEIQLLCLFVSCSSSCSRLRLALLLRIQISQ